MVVAAAISAVVYLIVPDILSPIETILFLWTVFILSSMCIFWIQEQIERIRTKRESLCIRKNRRSEKVIDFRMRSKTIYIPAFKVRRDA